MSEFETYSNYSSIEICAKLRWNGPFIITTLLVCLFSFSASILSILLFKLVNRHRGLFHANVRLILLHFGVANCASSIWALFRVVYNLVVISCEFQPFVVSRVHCILVDGVGIVPTTVACVSVGVVGVERFVATVRKNISDPDKSSKCANIVLIGLWFMALISLAVAIYDANQFADQSICYCAISLAVSQMILYGNLPWYLCFNASYLFCYFYVYKRNKHDMKLSINTAKHNLQERYQKWNNILLSKSFIPNVISNSILLLTIGCSYYFIHPFYWREQSINAINAWMSVSVLISMVAFLQPLLFITCNEKIKKIASNEYRLLKYITGIRFSIKRPQIPDPVACENEVDKSTNIVSYKCKPEDSQLILDNIWDKHYRV